MTLLVTDAKFEELYGAWLTEGYAILTAHRPERSPAQNGLCREELERAVDLADLGHVSLEGRWKDGDGTVHAVPALLVPAIETECGLEVAPEVREFAIRQGRRFEQEAVIWHSGSSGVETIYVGPSGEEQVDRKPRLEAEDTRAVFSPPPSSEGRELTFDGLHVAEGPKSFSEALAMKARGRVWPNSSPPVCRARLRRMDRRGRDDPHRTRKRRKEGER